MSARHLDLLRKWSVCPDPDDAGLAGCWWEDAPKEGWVSTRIGAWQHVLGEEYHGVAWYRRRARLPKKWLGGHQRVWVRFEAVATDCRVWVNGMEVGRHVGDYLPFQFEITEALAGNEKCEIVCRVDEIQGHEPKEWGKEPWGGHITKGFHDVLSLQHGGIWDRVRVFRTGNLVLEPNGVHVAADPRDGSVRVSLDLEPHEVVGQAEIGISFKGELIATAPIDIRPGREATAALTIDSPLLWDVDEPNLYEVHVRLTQKVSPHVHISDDDSVRFGFRTARVGGEDGTRVLLNDRPLTIRGVLDWGHEPAHIAPTPTKDELRERFTQLKARGFNCVCLCMWYPPAYFFDIADEVGMLIWQEHPVWKSDMSDEYMDEYKRLFEGFMRRDRNRASVILVSGACEHECFSKELGVWWWDRARELMPRNLLQVQTAFFAWLDPDRTDLWDEHTYDSPGRWAGYLEDLQGKLGELEPKPFIMGETILFTSWPDVAAITAAVEDGSVPAWSAPKGLAAFAALETAWAERYGQETVDRFKHQGDRQHLLGRKFEYELFRRYGNHAGVVMNHLRDVWACQCGFMDDLDRWRFGADEFASWLNDAPILLKTPGDLRGFVGGKAIEVDVGVSNFGRADFDGSICIGSSDVRLTCSRGDVVFGKASVELPRVEGPTRIVVEARGEGLEGNSWDLWVFPERVGSAVGAYRMEGLEITAEELPLEFEEKCYSSGWGLPVRSWERRLADAGAVAPRLAAWSACDELPDDARVVVVHRLTEAVVDFLVSGGRVVLLASQAKGGVGTAFFQMWSQVPLVLERGPLVAGDSEWVVDLINHDLTRRVIRPVPTGEMGIADAVDPVIRLIKTHDKKGPEMFDMVFSARVGEGLLVVSALGHGEDAGGYLLDRIVGFAGGDGIESDGRLEEGVVRSWVLSED